jgi:hypothetical protein
MCRGPIPRRYERDVVTSPNELHRESRDHAFEAVRVGLTEEVRDDQDAHSEQTARPSAPQAVV